MGRIVIYAAPMRTFPFFLALACFGCAASPTPDESALVSKVESAVLLPKGGGDLKCYERHYALLQGKELDDYVGVPLTGLAGRKVLVGHYRFGGHPGVFWVKSAKDFPLEIMDGGCDEIRVLHIVGELEPSIAATCAETIAGVAPEEIIPPRSC